MGKGNNKQRLHVVITLLSCISLKERMGCSLLTTRVTQRIPQIPRASLAPCQGCDLAGGSLNALAVTIVNSRSIVRSLWLFITSLFAGPLCGGVLIERWLAS